MSTISFQKPFLVTGAAGFIGSSLSRFLLSQDHSVIGVDRERSFQTRTCTQDLTWSQICPRESLFTWLKDTHPNLEAVFHLGACTNTMEARKDYLWNLNVTYSQKLWNYCSKHQIPFIYASSAATYGDGSLGYLDAISQIHTLRPLNLYGQSKQAFDLWALEQVQRKNTPPLWSGFKFFNVYGYGEFHKNEMSSVVYKAFCQIQKEKKVKLFKSAHPQIQDGEQKRDFIYVEDVAKILFSAFNNKIPNDIYNLGTGKARTFLDLAHAVFFAMDLPAQIEFIPMPKVLEGKYQYFTQANMEKLKNVQKNIAFTSLEEGVQKTIKQLQSKKALFSRKGHFSF